MNNLKISLLLAVIAFSPGSSLDPYLDQLDARCKEGSLFQCLKFRTLTWLEESMDRENVPIGEYARLVKMPQSQILRLIREQPEFSSSPRSSDSEWSLLMKFLSRRAEKYLKSTALEVTLTDRLTEGDRYRPRFIDEIYSEIDTIEDKNEKPYKRDQLKKLFIPLLVVLKLFKLKLLLFFALDPGTCLVQKFLGVLSIVVPVIIGYFKLCKPDVGQSYGSYGHSSFTIAHPSGIITTKMKS